jgi:flagellum-specific peptidoglycan hydrolase FlgJ
MIPKQFYSTYIQYATDSQTATGVPALATLAQAALESAWGAHAPGFNFFGIKDTDGINGNEQRLNTHEVVGGKTIAVQAEFRKYDTPAEGFIDHGNFLKRNPRYAKAFQFTDPLQFLGEVAKAGYATDPDYAVKLGKILHLLTA